MQAITKAMYDLMAADALLGSLLASYRGVPAIFTADPVPPDAGLPLIVTAGLVAGPTEVPEASKQTIAARPVRDIRIIDEAHGSMERISLIAMRVFWLFERAQFTIDGWHLVRSRASMPFLGESDGRFYTMMVTVTLAIEGVS